VHTFGSSLIEEAIGSLGFIVTLAPAASKTELSMARIGFFYGFAQKTFPQAPRLGKIADNRPGI
jgi:hypothetical protein